MSQPSRGPRSVWRRMVRSRRLADRDHLTALGGLPALSLDALTSVAYGPEAAVVVLAVAGTGAIEGMLPLNIVIAVLLGTLVLSYRQVIAVHPDGGGSYAVAKREFGPRIGRLAAAGLVVDYVLTAAVSLATGAASLASAFPVLNGHLLPVALAALVLLAAVNLRGLAESARLLMPLTVLFVLFVLAVIAAGLLHPAPIGEVGGPPSVAVTQGLGVLLLLKAFASGCTAISGVEAIANGVPVFREPRVRTAQRTQVLLGVLLALTLTGLGYLLTRDRVVPRADVTVLAQLTAHSLGTGWLYYAANLTVTLLLAAAANTSFGALPVLLALLAKDDRMPHVFALRSARPVHRAGVLTLAALTALLLAATGAVTGRLIPLFALGIFIGFTISQLGMVRHWCRRRPAHWRRLSVLNGTGAVLTLTATGVLLVFKFTEGAWVVVVVVPLLMLLFTRVERYYAAVARATGIGRLPARPQAGRGLVIVPVGELSAVTSHALARALSLGGTVVAVNVHSQDATATTITRQWEEWNPGVPLEVLPSPHHSLLGPIVQYVQRATAAGHDVTVLLPEKLPRRHRDRLLQGRRSAVLAALLRRRTAAVVSTVPYHLDSAVTSRTDLPVPFP
ncbi:APC family permease [Kitasatospora purpeofusca]|uniref:APC family permease n=1 Tax=Kitasatospora purpeofusca TaxID=67352 RepID=UPI002E1112AD|nr:amino acid permease [Kitasatospora purpeofusca]WSR29614.1 APC family permease [Kitasatospora purpeofusca]WSR37839.1 APC family permease [Kitasatospora purpeofusca]